MRKVRIISTRSDRPINFETSATTFGQLKNELLENTDEFSGFDFKNSKCVVRDKSIADIEEGKYSVSMDHEPLPAGEFNLYINPLKVSQGGLKYNEEKLEALKKAALNLVELVDDLMEEGEYVFDMEEDGDDELSDDELSDLEDIF